MSKASDEIRTDRKLVLVLDICSSTAILEDLLRTENQREWRNLLIRLKDFLMTRSGESSFEVYKFLGDGWILLFDDAVSGTDLIKLLQDTCVEYHRLFHQKVCGVLEEHHTVGMTFGADAGTLVRIVMTGRIEYVGRPLNIAARLQDALKQKDKTPHGKLLISKNAFTRLKLPSTGRLAGKLVTRQLRNISGGSNYQARKIVICRYSEAKNPSMKQG
jgi:class 3 adenylate cyclase